MVAKEANFDGLVGPTHNYAGLSYGNVASKSNANSESNPKQAALQGLAKMKALSDLGLAQGVIPPQQRPDVKALRRLGFSGSDKNVLESTYRTAPHLLMAVSSASSMWTANAATVSPSADTSDNKIHFTPANLTNKFHRSIEPTTTGNILRAIFNNDDHFKHHLHLPDNEHFGDEGAANHTRFCRAFGEQGVEFFVFGKYAFDDSKRKPLKYPARQTLEASQAVARLHGLQANKTVFAQQNPDIIDQGVFHNDVIAVGSRNVLFYHEQAFLSTDRVKTDIQSAFGHQNFHFVEVKTEDVSVQDAVRSYLFNTQLIELPSGEMVIIAPTECQQNEAVYAYLSELVSSNGIISDVKYFDVKQSMQNGGGPACLRLRVVLNGQEYRAVNQNCLINDRTYPALCDWVKKHYRDKLKTEDLADPALLDESKIALDELTQLLSLGSIFPFQR